MTELIRSYDVHGLSLRVEAETTALLDLVESVLSPLRVSAGRQDASVFLSCGPLPAGDTDGELRCTGRGTLPDGIGIACYVGADIRQTELLGLACVRLNTATLAARITVGPSAEWCVARGCIVPLLCQMLARRGQHVVHAACLAMDGRAVLLSGASGRGKTTTSLALAHSGMKLMGDDCCFARDDGDGLRVWGLLLDCKVHPNTLAMLPWLGELPRYPSPTSDEFIVDAREAVGVSQPLCLPPAAVLLLEPRNGHAHRLTPLGRIDALKRLLGENVRAPEAGSYESAGSAVRTLTRLASVAGVYHLSVGPNLETLGDFLLRELERS